MALAGGCVREAESATDARLRSATASARLDLTDAERFGYAEPKPAQATSRPSKGRLPAGHVPVGDKVAQQPPATDLRWKAPPEWLPRGGGSMRVEQFRIDGREGMDCYISELGAGAGGLLMNVNRWRSQIGLSPIAKAEAEQLPTLPVLGTQAQLVELESPDAERGMVVLAAFLADRSVFVKMQGSPAEIRAELPRFRAFCQTLEVAK